MFGSGRSSFSGPPAVNVFNSLGRFFFGWLFEGIVTSQTIVVGTNVNLSQSIGSADTLTTLASGDILRVLHSGATAQNKWLGMTDFISSPNVGGFNFVRFQNYIFRGAVLNIGSIADLYAIGIFRQGVVGATNAAPMNINVTAVLPYPGPHCAFFYSGLLGQTWRISCGTDAANATIIDTGVPLDTLCHEFRIARVGPTISFYIDEQIVGAISLNLPTDQTQMTGAVGVCNSNTASDKTLGVASAFTYLN